MQIFSFFDHVSDIHTKNLHISADGLQYAKDQELRPGPRYFASFKKSFTPLWHMVFTLARTLGASLRGQLPFSYARYPERTKE